MEMNKISLILTVVFMVILVLGTIYLIIKERSKDIYPFILCILICLVFSNIQIFKWFKIGSFEAQIQNKIDEANATITQLRTVSSITSEVLLSSILDDIFFEGMTYEQKISYHDKIISNLVDIGIKREDIENIERNWIKGIKILYYETIKHYISTLHTNKMDEKDKNKLEQINKEITRLTGVSKNPPTSNEIKTLLERFNYTDSIIDCILKDYFEFETSGIIKNKKMFDSYKRNGFWDMPL